MQQTEKTVHTNPKDKIYEYIEKMDEYQARLVLSFIKTLFKLTD